MSQAKFWDVLTKKEYIHDGETKTLWYRAGVIKTASSGKRYLQLFQYPNIDYFIVEPDDDQLDAIQI